MGMMPAFESKAAPRLVFGLGAVARLGHWAQSLGGSRALIVTDAGVRSAGHAGRAEASLVAEGLAVSQFDGVQENPTDREAQEVAAAAEEFRADLIVAVGGGSSMDAAKGGNLLRAGNGSIRDYQGYGRARGVLAPMIAIPTTAGTGSECQSYAIFSDAATHEKMACGDPQLLPRVAILDPLLTVTQPAHVTGATGIDALAHAIESYVSTRATLYSRMLAREAFEMLRGALPVLAQAPDNVEARGAALFGAALAGMSIENSMLGAAHATANPLTARWGWTHGLAVGRMLPSVIRWNADDPAVAREYARLSGASGEAIADIVESLMEAFGLNGARQEAHDIVTIERLAELAMDQWTGRFNPRPLERDAVVALYENALNGWR